MIILNERDYAEKCLHDGQSNMQIPFRKSCKDCECEYSCVFDAYSKMFKRRCYIDFMASKLKTTSKKLMRRIVAFSDKTDIYLDGLSEWINEAKDSWLPMSNAQRKDYLEYIFDDYELTKSEVDLLFAFLNTYLNAWRDTEYIACAKCGIPIQNSKQHNRRFCDECKTKRERFPWSNFKKCIDCGEEFNPKSNRQCRCVDCQKEANRMSARERARRYREKNHGLEQES